MSKYFIKIAVKAKNKASIDSAVKNDTKNQPTKLIILRKSTPKTTLVKRSSESRSSWNVFVPAKLLTTGIPSKQSNDAVAEVMSALTDATMSPEYIGVAWLCNKCTPATLNPADRVACRSGHPKPE